METFGKADMCSVFLRRMFVKKICFSVYNRRLTACHGHVTKVLAKKNKRPQA